MYQVILMNVDIDKCVEIGDVSDCFFQNYFWQQVVYGFNVIGELCGFKFRMWVVVWFFQFFDDIVYGWYVEFIVGKISGFEVM